MKKKNIIIILFIILVGLLVYFFLMKDNKNNEKPTEELVKNHELVISTAFSKLGLCSTGIYFDFTNKDKFTFNDLDETMIYHILYNYLLLNNKIEIESNSNGDAIFSESNNRVERIKKRDLEDAFKVLFGKKAFKNFEFKESFIVDIYEFNLVKDIYFTNKTESYFCHNDYQSNYYLVDKKTTDNKLILEYALYYSKFEFANNELKEYALYKPSDEYKICSVEDIEDNIGGFERYYYTFTFDGENYIFDNITLVK